MFASAGKAAAMLFDRDFLGIVLRSLLLTAALFIVLFAGIEYALVHLPPLGSIWVNRLLEVATPILLILAIFFLGAPVAAIFGSLYLDRIAAKVDAHFFPSDPKAKGTPLVTGLGEVGRLIALSVLINIFLLPVDIGIPGLAEIATVFANGWLLGREFFELASLRHLDRAQSDAMRAKHATRIYAAGLMISILTAIPVVNLIAPFFGSALMALLFKRFSHEERTA